MSTLEITTEIICDVCQTISEEDVHAGSRFIEDLNISSLETLSILSDIEDEFNIRISDRESRGLLTVLDLVNLIDQKKKS